MTGNTKDGPSSSGWSPPVAERKFTEWLGTYRSLDGVLLRLVEEHQDGREKVVKTWPGDREEIG